MIGDEASRKKAEFYNSLPRKRSAVGVLLFRKSDLLVVEPSYRPEWLVPGGVVESGESLSEAAGRECLEEIGCKVQMRSLLCVDYKSGSADTGDAIHFLFLGELAEGDQPYADGREIKSVQWLEPSSALVKLDRALALRVSCAMEAMKAGRTVYCENGKIVF